MNKKYIKRYKTLLNILQNPSILMKRKKYIFILSHWRSYSTLLSHILGSNKDICGYTEMHIRYFNTIDLQVLKLRSMERYGNLTNRKYILDKIVNNNLINSGEILRTKSISKIFLLRNYNDAIKSIIRYSATQGKNVQKYTDQNNAAELYIKRLSVLKEYSLFSKGNYIFIKSESLIHKTEETFDLLADYLNLEEELSSEYNNFELTGTPGYGDSSKYISIGNIVRDRIHTNIDISENLRLKCEKAYNECCETLKENSIKYI